MEDIRKWAPIERHISASSPHHCSVFLVAFSHVFIIYCRRFHLKLEIYVLADSGIAKALFKSLQYCISSLGNISARYCKYIWVHELVIVKILQIFVLVNYSVHGL